jgi:hypothetical protein
MVRLILIAWSAPTITHRDHAMTLPNFHNPIVASTRGAADETPTTAMFNELLATARRAGDPMRQALQVARLRQLIAVRAWSDAALALVALQSPEWKLRRLCYDDGEWHCALSRQRDMPEWLDPTVEAHHPNMPLAIVGALQEATRTSPPSHLAAVAVREGDDSFAPMSCENFS